MLGFVAGLPGQIATLTTRLSATWAAKLDALRTGLTDARMGYLDKLNVTGSVASAADVAALATLDSPLLKPPIAGGLTASKTTNCDLSAQHSAADVLASTTSTSYVDVINYTGAGVLEFCAFGPVGGSASSAQMEIIIDGVTAYSGSSSTGGASGAVLCPVGAISFYSIYTYMSLGAVPFRTSLRIRHKITGSTTSQVGYKMRKTG